MKNSNPIIRGFFAPAIILISRGNDTTVVCDSGFGCLAVHHRCGMVARMPRCPTLEG
jgi:hypothetical protein